MDEKGEGRGGRMAERSPEQTVHILTWVPPQMHGPSLSQAPAIATSKKFLDKCANLDFPSAYSFS